MRAWIGCILLMAGVLGPLQVRARDQTLVLEGRMLIDGTGRAPINDAVIVIDGSRITAVGSRGRMVADIGVPQMKVIQGATLWAAASFGKAKDLGSVEAGKLADLMVIDGNPLNRIE